MYRVGCSHIIAYALRKENVKDENLFPHTCTYRKLKKSSLRPSRHLIGFFWDKEKPKLKRKCVFGRKIEWRKKKSQAVWAEKLMKNWNAFIWLIHWHFFCKWWHNKSQCEIFLKNIICQKQIFTDWCSFAIDERRLLDINYNAR